MRRKCLVISVLLLLILSFVPILDGCAPAGEVKVYDKNGGCVAVLKKLTKLDDNEYFYYIESAVNEARQTVCEIFDCGERDADRRMLGGNYEIYTYLDTEVQKSVSSALDSESPEGENAGCAVCDLHGGLLAVYSMGEYSDKNYADIPLPPYSSFKPICVYAPSIENCNITWSTMFEDSPVKTLIDSDGTEYDWPQNATGVYSGEKVLLTTAIKKSLNTAAVRCMQQLGVGNSLDFMSDKFCITLKYESDKLRLQGEDEVIGSVALGYLYEGVSVIDMAGYYQCFANGGMYSAPKAIERICSADGDTVYERENDEKQVLNPASAYIMNNLLREVVGYDGTGREAAVDGVVVGGKTGTGDDGNWFVGFTPQYSCAVWHGGKNISNCAPKIFSQAVSEFSHDVFDYSECALVKKAAYCTESGKLIGSGCIKINMGYYDADHVPGVCDIHR